MTDIQIDEIRLQILRDVKEMVGDIISAYEQREGKIRHETKKAMIAVAADKLRNAEADVIQKSDPQAADVHRRLVPEF